MKSPIEIMNEINRLKELHNSIQNEIGHDKVVITLQAKLDALEWVLSEKP